MQVMSKQYIQVYKYIDTDLLTTKTAHKNLHVLPKWKQHSPCGSDSELLYVCADILSCGKTCEPESDHQWLGVSLSRQLGENGGRVLVMHNSFF